MMSEQVCEFEGCRETKTEFYTYAALDDGGQSGEWLCWEHAIEEGFCVWCGYFGAGDEDYDFSPMRGYHRDCYEALRYEIGEDGAEWDFYNED